MNPTKLTIITSLYNSEQYLPVFLRRLERNLKLLMQKAIETQVCFIGNDASQKERYLIQKFQHKFFLQRNIFIKLEFVKRETLYASWNRGIKIGTGEVITFWNVDDNRYPAALIEGTELIKNGAHLIYFPFWHISRRRRCLFLNSVVNRVFQTNQFDSVNYRRPIPFHPSIIFNKSQRILFKTTMFNEKEFKRSFHIGPFFMISKSFYNTVGPFDEQFRVAGDFDWQIRAAQVAEFTCSSIIAGEFYSDFTGLSSSGHQIHAVENNVIYQRYQILDKIENISNNLFQNYSIHHIQTKTI